MLFFVLALLICNWHTIVSVEGRQQDDLMNIYQMQNDYPNKVS